jgi:6-hydroxytryprostatin B O-methyltransferase
VPLNDSVSYVDLAATAGIPEQRLRSVVRMAMTNSLFREEPGSKRVSHSATSALLARNTDVYAYATYMCAKSAPTAMELAAAHQKWGADTMRTDQTAYNVAFNTDLPFFDHLGQDEARMSEFAAYMRNVRSSEAVNIKHLVSGFAWQGLGDGGKVVDVSYFPRTDFQSDCFADHLCRLEDRPAVPPSS